MQRGVLKKRSSSVCYSVLVVFVPLPNQSLVVLLCVVLVSLCCIV